MIKQAIYASGLALAVSSANVAIAQQYEVTVTNLTYSQVITPPVVIAHNKKFRLFLPGDSSSAELKILAESGNPGPLADAVGDMQGVQNAVAHDQVIPPGQSTKIMIETKRYPRFTVLGMLATTNDAFVASQGVTLGWNRSVTVDAPVYDAGTEANTELCADIPGPPCGGASNNEATEDAEGFIHIHRGFHGVNELDGDDSNTAQDGAGLSSSVFDWRDAGARITIKRIPH